MIFWKYVGSKINPEEFIIMKIECTNLPERVFSYKTYRNLEDFKKGFGFLEHFYFENLDISNVLCENFMSTLSTSQSFEEMEKELNVIYLLKEII